MYACVDEFIDDGIPAVIGDRSPLQALFMTYNHVIGYPTGDVATGKRGLSIWVQNGHLDCAFEHEMRDEGLRAGDRRFAVLGIKGMVDQRRRVQRTALMGLSDVAWLRAEERTVAVLYSGRLVSFQPVADSIKALARNFKKLSVVVLVCGCDFKFKRERLEALNADGCPVDHIIYTDECSGVREMGDILTALKEAW